MVRLCAAVLVVLSAIALAQPYEVGVLDVGMTGGTGASSSGFLKAFEDLPDYHATALAALDGVTLAQCDIVVLYDNHNPGNVTPKWRENLNRFAQAGGSILSIYHQHGFT